MADSEKVMYTLINGLNRESVKLRLPMETLPQNKEFEKGI